MGNRFLGHCHSQLTRACAAPVFSMERPRMLEPRIRKTTAWNHGWSAGCQFQFCAVAAGERLSLVPSTIVFRKLRERDSLWFGKHPDVQLQVLRQKHKDCDRKATRHVCVKSFGGKERECLMSTQRLRLVSKEVKNQPKFLSSHMCKSYLPLGKALQFPGSERATVCNLAQ